MTVPAERSVIERLIVEYEENIGILDDDRFSYKHFEGLLHNRWYNTSVAVDRMESLKTNTRVLIDRLEMQLAQL